MRIYREWGRAPARGDIARGPKRRKGVTLHHTVTECEGTTMAAERAHMRYLQEIAFQRGFSDISYNHILFPKTGRIYRGRGFRQVGAHNDGMNTDFLGLVVVGNFEEDAFPQKALQAVIEYIRKAEDKGHLPEHPVVFAHGDTDSTACPGKNVKKNMDTIRHAVGGRKLS